ncbi:hypothetical protein C8R45DRAFT_1179832 [Mycena sanguinolenta]|nr:hypothetical protein C8R45DRAFT_1179832 [Mycena sanguinolenta]
MSSEPADLRAHIVHASSRETLAGIDFVRLPGRKGHGHTTATVDFVLEKLPSLVQAALMSALEESHSQSLHDNAVSKILSQPLITLDERIKDEFISLLPDALLGFDVTVALLNNDGKPCVEVDRFCVSPPRMAGIVWTWGSAINARIPSNWHVSRLNIQASPIALRLDGQVLHTHSAMVSDAYTENWLTGAHRTIHRSASEYAKRGINVFAFDQREFGRTALDEENRSPESEYGRTHGAAQMDDRPLDGRREALNFPIRCANSGEARALRGVVACSPIVLRTTLAAQVPYWKEGDQEIIFDTVPVRADGSSLARDPLFKKMCTEDPLSVRRASSRHMSDLIHWGEELLEKITPNGRKSFKIAQLLIAHGSGDLLTSHLASQALHDKLNCDDKHIIIYQDMISFIEQRSPPPSISIDVVLSVAAECLQKNLGCQILARWCFCSCSRINLAMFADWYILPSEPPHQMIEPVGRDDEEFLAGNVGVCYLWNIGHLRRGDVAVDERPPDRLATTSFKNAYKVDRKLEMHVANA